jgi:hypothetical protein
MVLGKSNSSPLNTLLSYYQHFISASEIAHIHRLNNADDPASQGTRAMPPLTWVGERFAPRATEVLH